MFSVVIPAYNCEKTIVRVLESVFNQTRSDSIEEIIIVNDGSTDQTNQVIKEFIKKHDQINIIYLEQENHGVSYSRNRGIKKATADWIALLDSDDVWLPNKLERQMQCIEKHENMVFLGCDENLKFFFHKKSGLYKVSAKELCIRNTPATPSIVFKRTIGLELGLFNEHMKFCEDINFYQKFLLRDSYYVLVEKLIEIGIGKQYFGQTGLTSHLYQMHIGRKKNTKELYEMGLISKRYEWLMQLFNNMKFFRRYIIRKINLKRYAR